MKQKIFNYKTKKMIALFWQCLKRKDLSTVSGVHKSFSCTTFKVLLVEDYI